MWQMFERQCSERNLYFLYLIRTFGTVQGPFSESARIFMITLMSKSYDQFTMALFDDLKLGWNLGNVTNVWTSISERNLYFLYLIRTSNWNSSRTIFRICKNFMIALMSKSYDQFTMALFDDLKLGWNLGNVTNVWTSISERNLYFLYLIRTSLEQARTSLQNLQEFSW